MVKPACGGVQESRTRIVAVFYALVKYTMLRADGGGCETAIEHTVVFHGDRGIIPQCHIGRGVVLGSRKVRHVMLQGVGIPVLICNFYSALRLAQVQQQGIGCCVCLVPPQVLPEIRVGDKRYIAAQPGGFRCRTNDSKCHQQHFEERDREMKFHVQSGESGVCCNP